MNHTEQMREALRQNVRAFRHSESGEIKYLLSNADDESQYDSVMIIPNLPNYLLDQALAVEPAKLVRLSDEELNEIADRVTKTWLANSPRSDIVPLLAAAIRGALEAKNGGKG